MTQWTEWPLSTQSMWVRTQSLQLYRNVLLLTEWSGVVKEIVSDESMNAFKDELDLTFGSLYLNGHQVCTESSSLIAKVDKKEATVIFIYKVF